MRETKNDKIIKFTGIITLGVLIPNLTGLINNAKHSFSQLLVHYTFFVGISAVIWQGNVWLMYLVRSRLQLVFRFYYKTVIALFVANILYSGLLAWLLLSCWEQFFQQVATAPNAIAITTLVIIIAALFITNIYEIVFLNREKENTLSKVEKLNIANAHAELEALKNQIDPHFIFNSLNTLSYLISKDPQNARLYNDTLAKVYRYILSNKERDLVFLKEEVEFMSNYFYLLKIRFNHAIDMEIEMADLDTENFLIPPISLQVLLENAVKHNEFSENKKLQVHITVTSGYVMVTNATSPKSFKIASSGTGLANLGNRYKLITKRNILVDDLAKRFTVKLPILKL